MEMDYVDIDAQEKFSDIYCTSYAPEIFELLKEREVYVSLASSY